MSILYRVGFRLNPKTGKDGFSARVVSTPNDQVTPEKAAEAIARQLSMTAGEVEAVLRELATLLHRELPSGRTVTLRGIGTFRVSVRSGWVATPEEFDSRRHLKQARIGLRRAPEMAELEEKLDFVLYSGVPGRPANGESPAPDEKTDAA